jgi:protein involved in polysaccharide export with SLBB domain
MTPQPHSLQSGKPVGVRVCRIAVVAFGCLLSVTLLSGCASWTNPVANGIPVRLVPPELLAQPKESLIPLPLTELRRKPAERHLLGPGDLLGIYIEGVLGEEGELPPVNVSASGSPSLGFPMPVRDDGTLPLPLIDPVPVEGLTLQQAQERIIHAYTRANRILIPGESRFILTLIEPRRARILVIREDSAQGEPGREITRTAFGENRITGRGRRGTGAIVELPSNQADVLAALAQTGGLPGSDAEDEVIIQRGYAGDNLYHYLQSNLGSLPEGNRQIVRIPLRLPPGSPLPFRPEDIALMDGDIVFVEARDTEFYYTGGLLPSIEVPVPRDYDLDVVEAVAQVGGILVRGGNNSNNLTGSNVSGAGGAGGGGRLGTPSPSLLTVLRRLPDGGQVPIRVDLNEALRDPRENILVQSGDILILQETTGESFSRYLADAFFIDVLHQFLDRGDVQGVVNFSGP